MDVINDLLKDSNLATAVSLLMNYGSAGDITRIFAHLGVHAMPILSRVMEYVLVPTNLITERILLLLVRPFIPLRLLAFSLFVLIVSLAFLLSVVCVAA